MCFDRNINGNRNVKFLIGIIGHCTDQRKLLYRTKYQRNNPKNEKMKKKITHL